MAKNDYLDEFLEKEIPDWRDVDVARARFKAFTGQKQDWEDRLPFWKELITKVARHLHLIVIDTDSVQQNWFIRDGVVPMGLPHVLIEMRKSGELQTVEEVLGARPAQLQWLGSIMKKALVWTRLSVLTDIYSEIKTPPKERLVVLAILQERVRQFLQTLAEGHHSLTSIATMAKIKDLSGGSEDAELIMGYLVTQNKARFMSVSDQIELRAFGRALKYL